MAAYRLTCVFPNHTDEKNSADRRSVLKGLAVGGLIGLSGFSAASTPVAAESGTSFSDPSWEETIPVEKDIGNNLVINLVYAFTEVNTKIIDGETVERNSHFFQLSAVGHSAPVDQYTTTYNIAEQSFKATELDDHPFSIEFNETNAAGASAWPNPNSGNWDEVLEVVLEKAVTQASTIVDIGLTVSEIYEAYQQEGFGTDIRDTIEYSESYLSNKITSSHSVDFIIDTKRSTFPAAEITSRISDDFGTDYAEATFQVDFTYEAKEPSESVDSLASTGDEEQNEVSLLNNNPSPNGRAPPYSELSEMTDKELEDIGITRVRKSDMENAKKSLEEKLSQVPNNQSAENNGQGKKEIKRQLRGVKKAKKKLHFDNNRETYVKKTPMNVTTEAKASDSEIAITEP